eukprot:Amastigsp_a176879_60.p1 type:complete len:110 gc:universal Amastigsp_a176879_60:57-386(+)
MASPSQQKRQFRILGYATCPYFKRVKDMADRINDDDDKAHVTCEAGTEDDFDAAIPRWLAEVTQSDDPDYKEHETCPLVLEVLPNGGIFYVGGCDKFTTLCRKCRICTP